MRWPTTTIPGSRSRAGQPLDAATGRCAAGLRDPARIRAGATRAQAGPRLDRHLFGQPRRLRGDGDRTGRARVRRKAAGNDGEGRRARRRRRQGQQPQAGGRLHPPPPPVVDPADRRGAQARRALRVPHEPQPAVERPHLGDAQDADADHLARSSTAACTMSTSCARSPTRKPVEVRGMGLRLSDEIKPDMYNYGHLQVLFEDGSVGWYEAAWGPMISETAFFVKDVMSPNGAVSIVMDPGAKSDDIDTHTRTDRIRVHRAATRRRRQVRAARRDDLDGGRAGARRALRPRAGFRLSGHHREHRPRAVTWTTPCSRCASAWLRTRACGLARW